MKITFHYVPHLRFVGSSQVCTLRPDPLMIPWGPCGDPAGFIEDSSGFLRLFRDFPDPSNRPSTSTNTEVLFSSIFQVLWSHPGDPAGFSGVPLSEIFRDSPAVSHIHPLVQRNPDKSTGPLRKSSSRSCRIAQSYSWDPFKPQIPSIPAPTTTTTTTATKSRKTVEANSLHLPPREAILQDPVGFHELLRPNQTKQNRKIYYHHFLNIPTESPALVWLKFRQKLNHVN